MKCVCHSIRSMFGVLGLYNFALGVSPYRFKQISPPKNNFNLFMQLYFTNKNDFLQGFFLELEAKSCC